MTWLKCIFTTSQHLLVFGNLFGLTLRVQLSIGSPGRVALGLVIHSDSPSDVCLMLLTQVILYAHKRMYYCFFIFRVVHPIMCNSNSYECFFTSFPSIQSCLSIVVQLQLQTTGHTRLLYTYWYITVVTWKYEV